MASHASQKASPSSSSSSDTRSLKEIISKRFSKELFIALCGPLGCGIKQVKGFLEQQLQSAGYEVIDIRISQLMQQAIEEHSKLSHLKELLPLNQDDNAERIASLQTLGNKLRDLEGHDLGAQLAVREIAIWRERHSASQEADKLAISKNTAFIIDQLKHPDEVRLLKTVYKDIFYQIGILSVEGEKLHRLKGIGIKKTKATELIEADRDQDLKHGQQLEKTLLFSDYFIANTERNLPSLQKNINRFLSLVHGANGLTPTKDEVGMYTAYSSSLRSACLSRQVGAAICDDEGNVLSVGRNDVPKFNGGLYTVEDGDHDHRCINHGAKCHNTEHINILKTKIAEILRRDGGIEAGLANDLVNIMSDHTPLGSLIEYSRAIHAEMDAIISLARTQTCSTKGATIFTTTFPCHNCARHIVAAGIKRVVYIEPYAKSLAMDLHNDSICWEETSTQKVHIVSFEGVAPIRYQNFFLAHSKRKDAQGKAITKSIENSDHIESVIVAKYTDTEKVVSDRLTRSLDSAAASNLIPISDPDA